MATLSNDLLPGARAAADYVGVTPRIIYGLVENKLLPCTKLNRRLYFRKSQLDAVFSAEAE